MVPIWIRERWTSRRSDYRTRSMREHFRRLFTDATNDIIDAVAAQEKGEGGAPDARELRRRRSYEENAVPRNQKNCGFGPADSCRGHTVLVRQAEQRVAFRCCDDRARLRLAEE